MRLHLNVTIEVPDVFDDPELTLEEIFDSMTDEYPSLCALLADVIESGVLRKPTIIGLGRSGEDPHITKWPHAV